MSLFFGCDAKKIKNEVRKNVDNQEVAKLKEEVEMLKRQLHSQSYMPAVGLNTGTLGINASTQQSTKMLT